MIARLAALAILDMAMLVWGAIGGGSVGGVLGAHAVLTIIGFATWLHAGSRADAGETEQRTLGFTPAILGVLGPIGMLVALPLRFRAARSGTAQAVDLALAVPPRRAPHLGAKLAVARMLDGRVLHAPPEMLSSLVTIMRHGDVVERRRALETVVRSFQPALSPLVALALTDADQTIRALAAAAAARVAQNLAMSRATLEARRAEGGDPAVSLTATTTLATLLADHARADVLLSDSQRLHLREDAVAMLVEAYPDLDHPDAMRDGTMLEALWAAGDYDAIDRLAEAVSANDEPVETARWWRDEAAA